MLGMAFAVTPAGAATPSTASWQQAVSALPVPAAGCFTADFPVAAWHAVSCHQGPEVPFGPASAGGPASTIGNGVDYSATSSGGLLRNATGSFPSVSAGTTEKGIVPISGSPKEANTFSLQLNSSFFSGSPACSTAAKPSKCLGWQQFVLSTDPDPNEPVFLFMQYWLINYKNPCPSSWFTYGTDCYTNSKAINPPALTAAQLSTVSLKGTAKTRGSDQVILTNGTHDYSGSNSDSVVDLAAHWNTAEFGVFGDGGGSKAIFS